jgi:ABC-type multidrug transport system ATPase subunit
VALIGPKDSGKTCMLRLLAGLEKQDRGEVYIKDIPLEKVDYSVDVSVGYIPYKASFFDKKSVYDNLKYILEIRKTDRSLLEEKINKAIIDFKLESIAQEKVYKLTLYEKYLVSIARLSFRNQLDLVLVDNIFEELSPGEVKELIKLFKKYFAKQSTLLIIATSDEQIANVIATKKVFLKYGTIDKVENN